MGGVYPESHQLTDGRNPNLLLWGPVAFKIFRYLCAIHESEGNSRKQHERVQIYPDTLLYSLSPPKARSKARLSQQTQDGFYFYSRIFTFIEQFHSKLQVLLRKSFLCALHVDIFLH